MTARPDDGTEPVRLISHPSPTHIKCMYSTLSAGRSFGPYAVPFHRRSIGPTICTSITLTVCGLIGFTGELIRHTVRAHTVAGILRTVFPRASLPNPITKPTNPKRASAQGSMRRMKKDMGSYHATCSNRRACPSPCWFDYLSSRNQHRSSQPPATLSSMLSVRPHR